MANMTALGSDSPPPVAFPFVTNFPALVGTDKSAPLIDAACVIVETEWSGIFTFFNGDALQTQKQNILEGYLVGWWLADMYPTAVVGIQADGGMPLTSKSIGGVSISRQDLDLQPGLRQLGSNAFGVKAVSMIMNAPERMILFGQLGSRGSGSLNPLPGGDATPGVLWPQVHP